MIYYGELAFPDPNAGILKGRPTPACLIEPADAEFSLEFEIVVDDFTYGIDIGNAVKRATGLDFGMLIMDIIHEEIF